MLGGNPQDIPSALIDKPAPDVALPPVEGLTADGSQVPGFSGADLAGKVSVVNVFASWCVPCRQEHPLLEDLARVGGVQLIGINYKDKPENARRLSRHLAKPLWPMSADAPDGSDRLFLGGLRESRKPSSVDAERHDSVSKYIGPLQSGSYRDTLPGRTEKVLAEN
ncbi:UNVERIFIED_CONTAM: hypothetical protein GTU68_052565 [Idotea baltica]|nr:hypothetical protein [Idotea baltica]